MKNAIIMGTPMANKTYKVWRPDQSETIDDAHDFVVKNAWTDDPEDIGADYGEFYWDYRDGWESSWPIEFHIADEDGKFIGAVDVYMAARPHFYAKTIKDNPEKTERKDGE